MTSTTNTRRKRRHRRDDDGNDTHDVVFVCSTSPCMSSSVWSWGCRRLCVSSRVCFGVVCTLEIDVTSGSVCVVDIVLGCMCRRHVCVWMKTTHTWRRVCVYGFRRRLCRRYICVVACVCDRHRHASVCRLRRHTDTNTRRRRHTQRHPGRRLRLVCCRRRRVFVCWRHTTMSTTTIHTQTRRRWRRHR
jgi:hypothetical protein